MVGNFYLLGLALVLKFWRRGIFIQFLERFKLPGKLSTNFADIATRLFQNRFFVI